MLISRFTGGRRGVVFVVAAVLSVVVALAVGKYAAFAYLIQDEARRQYGEAGAAYFGYFSAHTWDAFTAHLSEQFSAFYLLWVGLAASVAWRRLGPSVTARCIDRITPARLDVRRAGMASVAALRLRAFASRRPRSGQYSRY